MKLNVTSRKTTSSTPLAAAASSVCCMCGGRGLIEELIRCLTCQFRLQHRYCSNLYPGADRYSTCNWCLKEGRGGEQSTGGETSIITDRQNKPVVNCSSSSDGSGRGSRMMFKLQRSTFAAADKPIKKQLEVARKSLLPSTSTSTSSGMIRKTGSSKTLITSSSGRREQKNGFRGRVKRYKLLEEIFSSSMEYR